MKKTSTLVLAEHNQLQDRAGRTVASISERLDSNTRFGYAHVFAVAEDICKYVEEKIRPILSKFDGFQQTAVGYQAFSNISPHGNFPDWVKRGLQVITMIGGETELPNNRSLASITLNPLAITNNVLEDLWGQQVATISLDLGNRAVDFSDVTLNFNLQGFPVIRLEFCSAATNIAKGRLSSRREIVGDGVADAESILTRRRLNKFPTSSGAFLLNFGLNEASWHSYRF